LSLFKGFRASAQESFERELGADASSAALAAIAMHPFVRGSPRPKSTDYIKLVRQESRTFTAKTREVRSSEELLALARSFVGRWYLAAQSVGEERYVKEFGDALRATARPGDTAGEIFGRG
jgi:hypothetical protein